MLARFQPYLSPSYDKCRTDMLIPPSWDGDIYIYQILNPLNHNPSWDSDAFTLSDLTPDPMNHAPSQDRALYIPPDFPTFPYPAPSHDRYAAINTGIMISHPSQDGDIFTLSDPTHIQ